MLAEGNWRVEMLAYAASCHPERSSVMSAANDGTQSRDLLFACVAVLRAKPQSLHPRNDRLRQSLRLIGMT